VFVWASLARCFEVYARNAAWNINMTVLTSKGRQYGIFLSVRFHWALLACLRWPLGTFGLPWMPLDGRWGSICHLRGSIGASLGSICRLWGSIEAPLGVLGGHFDGHFAMIFEKEDFKTKTIL